MDCGATGKTIWRRLSEVALAAVIGLGLAIPVLSASGALSVPDGGGAGRRSWTTAGAWSIISGARSTSRESDTS